MNAAQLISSIMDQGITINVDGDQIRLTSRHKITDEIVNMVKTNKPAILTEFARQRSDRPTECPLFKFDLFCHVSAAGSCPGYHGRCRVASGMKTILAKK